MVRTELITQLKAEINHYLGIPYFSNVGIYKNNRSNAYVGKGSAKEIALATVEPANLENIKLLDLSTQQIYNFQKKHHLGIDCSGLTCHLLNFYASLIEKKLNLNPRAISASNLTSLPLASKINLKDATTADLVRQNSGKHVVFIVEKTADSIIYVESKKIIRKVTCEKVLLTDTQFFRDGIFRLNSLI